LLGVQSAPLGRPASQEQAMAFRQPGNATQLFPGKGNFNEIVRMFEQFGKGTQYEWNSEWTERCVYGEKKL
jgi:hypothetical protein